MDSLLGCFDKKHFRNYPYLISYDFNSRGFRDSEWPTDLPNLKSSIWCIGDSFTVGLGSPMDHIWSYVLQKKTNKRTINVSMDGASNEWISKTAVQIIEEINPDLIVICWSYPERRIGTVDLGLKLINTLFINAYKSIKNSSWPVFNDIYDFNRLDIKYRKEFLCEHTLQVKPLLAVSNDFKITDVFVSDDFRILGSTNDSHETDLNNLLDCIKKTEQHKIKKIVHGFIPNFCNTKYQSAYLDTISQILTQPIYIERIDLARDSHHFDIKTSEKFCNKVVQSYIKQSNLQE